MDSAWVFWASLGALGVGAFNTFLAGTKDSIPPGVAYKLMYLSILLIFAGLFSVLILLYYRFTHKKKFDILISKTLKPPFTLYILPSIIMIIYLISNLLALVEGGGVAMVIINLNTIITIIAGVLLFKDKLNFGMIVGIIISVLSAAFIAYEKSKL